MRLRRLLSRISPMYPGEGPVVLLCLLVNFCIFAGIMFGRNSRDSLFLYYFGVQYLPYMYFANAVSLVGCSVVYTSLVDRIERGKFLGSISLFFVAALIASRIVLGGHPHWFFPVLYVEAQVIWIFSLMQFWTFAGDLFDTRQAKRLFPLIAVGALLGMISVGLFCKQIIGALGTENLLLIWAGLIFVALALGGIAYRRYRRTEEAPKQDLVAAAAAAVKPSEWQKIKDGFRDLGREPLLRSMAGYVFLLWTVFAIVDFCYSSTVRLRFQNDPNGLTTFFGRFVGAQGLCCLIVQLFLTRAVINRLGVGTTINFHPAVLFLGTSWMGLRYGFGSVVSTKLADATMLYTFSDSSYQLLYNPVPPDRRPRVRGFMEGYIRPLSLAAAGALVLVGNNLLKTFHWRGMEIVSGQQLSWGAIVLAAAWLGFALTAKKGYIRALLRNLQQGSTALQLHATNALSKLSDPASLRLLAETLQSEQPERILAAIHFLEVCATGEAAEALAALGTHADPLVRATAIAALGRSGQVGHVDLFTASLRDPDPRVRANALDALASTHDPQVVEKARSLLQDASRRVRINAVLALATLPGAQQESDWLPMLRELAHGHAEERSTAIFALERLPSESSMGLLCELMHDPDLNLRVRAAKALGVIGSPRVVPALVEALGGAPEVRHVSRRSLAAIAQKGGIACAQQLAQTALTCKQTEIRSELADVLGRLEGPQVIPTLITLLKDPEWRVRWKVLKSFEHRARSAPLPQEARAALFQYASDELTAFRESVLYSQALVPKPTSQPERILAQALEEDRVKIEERVFHMLGILCGREQMLAIFTKLNSGDARRKADALEALDNLAPKTIGKQILGLLEPAPTPSGAQSEAVENVLRALVHHSKPWVRVCTASYLGEHPVSEGQSLLLGLLADSQGMVRETALWAESRAYSDACQAQVLAARQSPDEALRRAAQRISFTRAEATDQSPRSTPMLTVEKVLILKSAPLFAGLDNEELAALADIALEKEFAPDEIIFEEGQAGHHLYVVVQGKVEVFRRADSSEYHVAMLGEEECFGEMSILEDALRSASVKALEPTRVLKIDRESFRELITERPQIAFAIFKMLSGRLRHMNLEVEHAAALESHRNYA